MLEPSLREEPPIVKTKEPLTNKLTGAPTQFFMHEKHVYHKLFNESDM
jgi:hypothetical protein